MSCNFLDLSLSRWVTAALKNLRRVRQLFSIVSFSCSIGKEAVLADTKAILFNNIIIIFIYCNWVVTRWQWLFYMYTKHEIGYY